MPLTVEGYTEIDYKDVELLKNYITETGKIIPSRITGTSAKFQTYVGRSYLACAFLALITFAINTNLGLKDNHNENYFIRTRKANLGSLWRYR